MIIIEGAMMRGRLRIKLEDNVKVDLKELSISEDMTSYKSVWRLIIKSVWRLIIKVVE